MKGNAQSYSRVLFRKSSNPFANALKSPRTSKDIVVFTCAVKARKQMRNGILRQALGVCLVERSSIGEEAQAKAFVRSMIQDFPNVGAKKWLPTSVMVVSGLSAGIELGLMLVNVGAGVVTLKICGADVPPPGPALMTVMEAGPTMAKSAAGMSAVNVVPLTKVGANGVAPRSAAELLRKLVPVSVIVVLGLPAGAERGDGHERWLRART